MWASFKYLHRVVKGIAGNVGLENRKKWGLIDFNISKHIWEILSSVHELMKKAQPKQLLQEYSEES